MGIYRGFGVTHTDARRLSALVRPPITSNALSRYGLSKRRDWPFRRLEHNAVLANESESLACSHRRNVFAVGPTSSVHQRPLWISSAAVWCNAC